MNIWTNLDRVIDLAASNPWNVPEWDDASAYPQTNSQSVDYWRWEFLRRDIGYRKAWLDFQENQEGWIVELITVKVDSVAEEANTILTV